MTTEQDEVDLVETLRRALDAFPDRSLDIAEPPASVIEGAKWVHEWRNMDAELAELTFDSTEGLELAGFRSTGSLRELTFVSGQHSIEIEIEPGPRTVTLHGTVEPPVVGSMQIVVGGEVFTGELDESGAFTIEGVAPGTVLAFVDTPGGKIRLGSFEV